MAPHESSNEVEDRLYELLETTRSFDEIADDLGVTGDELSSLMSKVIAERGNPNLDAARRARERLARIQF